MIRYSAAAGLTTATAATLAHGIAAIWNASAVKGILVVGVKFYKSIATADVHAFARITARGTPAGTVTPDIDNDYNKAVAPASGALIDSGVYSVQPTVSTPSFEAIQLPAAIGSGYNYVFPSPIRVAAGEGLAIVTGAGTIGQPGYATFIWDE